MTIAHRGLKVKVKVVGQANEVSSTLIEAVFLVYHVMRGNALSQSDHTHFDCNVMIAQYCMPIYRCCMSWDMPDCFIVQILATVFQAEISQW